MDPHLLADIAAFTTALIAVIGAVSWFFLRKTKVTTEMVDAPVLVEFRKLTERVVMLEVRLANALDKIALLESTEGDLNMKLARREERILLLERENANLSRRVDHLEQVCKRAGINGDALDNPSDV